MMDKIDAEFEQDWGN